ncbi:actin polymerization protein [Grosmannia clavigera kw1407]|uniref:Protein BZZ1 n=1 Tax=Grosmannia clavigera (strain kw1407 / UAMH 11150) TaxID=655863 RepID=F0XSX1_GROCL|nr:actin polymerization protein [Grosmannia clavigera kw1407]EFW99324.1 actin polymerization protein [Grosmannia clavigera kw1407]
MENPPTFGSELKDGFKPANAWVSNGIAWLDDIQQFYRERSVIEKEYSAKLKALAKKYFEKKTKKSAVLSVGETPASLTTWTTQLTTLESRADEHDRFGNDLVGQVAQPLQALATRFEELRKRHADYADKIEKERDVSYAELRKVKTKYDAVCQEVEGKRKKTETGFGQAKAMVAYQQQLVEMNNVKNTYLIAINVTNKQKERYYQEYVPELLDSLQDLSEFRTIRLNGIWTLASELEANLLRQSVALIDHQTQEIPRNLPQLDSMMYMRHNAPDWAEPADKVFEPSPVWHDDDAMVVDDNAKIFLRNMLNKSKGQLSDLRREVDTKRRDVEAVKRLKQRVREGTEKKDEVATVSQMFALQEELHQVERKRITAEVETATITTAVGDVTLGARSHNFKSQTFKIPTNCDLCGERIWGLSAKGFDCRDCGYTCHSKCEMKVPAECPGEQNKEERKKLKQERQEAANALLKPGVSGGGSASDSVSDLPNLSRSNTMTSLSSGYATSAHRSISGARSPTAGEEAAPPAVEMATSPRVSSSSVTTRKSRILAPPPAAYITELPGSSPGGGPSAETAKGRMLYSFEASGDGELSVPEGREVVILEPDSGSGWVKVRAGYKEGLVPASYVEAAPATAQNAGQSTRPTSAYSNSGSSISTVGGGASKKKGPAVAPRRGAKKLKYVEALYAYTAQSDAEHSMEEGERFVLVKEDPGDGWAEVEKGGLTKSVPASYVQPAI